MIGALGGNAEELRARVEAGEVSDLDVLVDLADEHNLTMIDLIRLRDRISIIAQARADVTVRKNIKPFL